MGSVSTEQSNPRTWRRRFTSTNVQRDNQRLNRSSPEIQMHILLTVLLTLLMGLVRRICLNIKTSYPRWSLSLFLSLECLSKCFTSLTDDKFLKLGYEIILNYGATNLAPTPKTKINLIVQTRIFSPCLISISITRLVS